MSVRAEFMSMGRLVMSRSSLVSSRADRGLLLFRRTRTGLARRSQVLSLLAQLFELPPDPLGALTCPSRPTRTQLTPLADLVAVVRLDHLTHPSRRTSARTLTRTWGQIKPDGPGPAVTRRRVRG
jgi:hypothetical protein